MTLETNRHFLAFIGLLLIILLNCSAYSNTFESPVVLDDTHSFASEPLVQNFDWSFESVCRISKSKFGWARFIPMLTLAHDNWRTDGDLSAFHETNLLIHILNTIAVFFFVKVVLMLTVEYKLSEDKFWVTFLALSVSSIWSLMPVETNAVTYIVQRMTSIATLFYVVSFTCYFAGRKIILREVNYKAVFLLLFSLLCFLCAIMSKENTFILPVVIFLGEWFFFREQLSQIFNKHRRLVCFVCVISFIFVSFFAIKKYNLFLLGYEHRHFDLNERLLTELRVIVNYIKILLFPSPYILCLDRHVVLSTSLLSPWATLFSLLFIIMVLWFAFIWRNRYPVLSFSLLWFFLNLFIESSFVPLELMFEHRLYLPSIGFYFFVVSAVACLVMKFNCKFDRKIAIAALVLFCSILAILTFERNKVWADAVTIYRDCVEKAPLKPRVHSNLSSAYLSAGKYKESIREARVAIALGEKWYEEYWVSSNNIISSYQRLGEITLACKKGEDFLKRSKPFVKKNALPIFYRNLALCYYLDNNFKAAFKYIQKAIILEKRTGTFYVKDVGNFILRIFDQAMRNGRISDCQDFGIDGNSTADVLTAVSVFFVDLSDWDNARKFSRLALKADPESEKAKHLLHTLKKMEDKNKKQREYGTIKSKYVFNFWKSMFNFNMAFVYMIEKQNLDFSIVVLKCLSSAKNERPLSPDPWLLDSWNSYKLKHFESAVEKIQRAILLAPDYAQAWVNLGLYQMNKGEYAQAENSLLTALKLYPGYPKKSYVEFMLESIKEKSGNYKD